MPSISPIEQASSSSPLLSRRQKYLLWALMGAATISVIFYSEIPLLFDSPSERIFLRAARWLVFPHAIAGVIALVSGPLQFSSRLRRGNPRFHRILGRVYVGSVFIAAPLAVVLTSYNHNPQAIYFTTAITVQSSAWFITTAAAFLAARARKIHRHRVWMVRSYAVTFTFILTRVLQPIPAWNRLGRVRFALAIMLIAVLASLVPEIASAWRRLSTRQSPLAEL